MSRVNFPPKPRIYRKKYPNKSCNGAVVITSRLAVDGAVFLLTQVKGRDVSGNIHLSFTVK